MEAGLDTSVVNPLGQPIGEMIGPGWSIPEAGGEPVAAGTPGHPAGEDTILAGPVALSFTRVARRRLQVTARSLAGGDVVAVDTVDLARAGQRQRFVVQVLEKLDLAEHDAKALEDDLDQTLLQLASSAATPAAPGHAAAPAAEFRVVEDADDPELNGLYATMPPAQIANFDMRIIEHVVVSDEDHQSPEPTPCSPSCRNCGDEPLLRDDRRNCD